MPERSEKTAVALLSEMGAELHRLYLLREKTEAEAMTRATWRVSAFNVRVVAILLVIMLAAATVALAASGLLSGPPVKPPFKAQPTKLFGVPVANSEKLLAISVADPAGGPPWGLRILKTTRGVGCLQYGRLFGGQLGVLGQDGAFANDHRFHALSPQDTFNGLGGCVSLDAHGNTFEALSSQGVPASAYIQGCVSEAMVGHVAEEGHPVCPADDERDIFYGALGPAAKSITYSLATRTETVRARVRGHGHGVLFKRSVYTLNGPSVTLPTVGREGAYLIVTRAGREVNPGLFGPEAPNANANLPYGIQQPIRAITYANGDVCHIGAKADLDNHGRPCAPIGYAPSTNIPLEAQVRSPLSVKVLYDHHDPPLKAEDVLRVSFIARVPITSARTHYLFQERLPSSGSCRGGTDGSTIDEDVPAGKRITFTGSLSIGPPGSKPCPGVYSGQVLYSTKPDFKGGLLMGGGLLVGRFSFRLGGKPKR